MKLRNVFCLTFVLSAIAGISSVQAAILGEPLVVEQQQSSDALTKSRFQNLSRGVNLSNWFIDSNQFDPNYITEQDLQIIKGLGLEHVRLPIAPSLLFDENNPTILNAEYQLYLDNALNQIQAAGLSAIINLQASNEFKQRLATDDMFVDSVAQFWRSLATHLSTRNPDQVFLEVVNEPSFNYFLRNEPAVDPVERWNLVQTKLVNAINEGAPNHTVILKGHDWGESIDSLLKLTPYQDETTVVTENPVPETASGDNSTSVITETASGDNSTPVVTETPVEIQKPSEKYVYNFHFYEPKRFTHQGATWIDDEFSVIKNLPYPFNEELCNAAVAEIVQETAKIWAQGYCNQKWDIARLERRISLAANWAKKHNVLLTANEFGVYRQVVRPEDRANWLRDVRSLFEKYNIGWAMWEYNSGFGLVRENENGDRIVDRDIATALGLTLPPIPPATEATTPSPVVNPETEIENSGTVGNTVTPSPFPNNQPQFVPSSSFIPNADITFWLTPEEVPPSKSVPEPSAIAGFLLLTYTARKLKRRI
ncbi:hypothetical protein NIES2119_05515 [[Phormidium ambiguum] IAM M-71]|uniref:Exo-1,3-beta-glucanase D n=1 Tax=[Phormidium ambiguum] IAM M-71 TaxID=454136 RepID=A0A1U7IQU3_9CYAN|nr:cellulase family glycosylhydrolase [Phormidium ambiguum]OKH39715.1 hypothetical protein NIES2119_05515 [Phormidium ambiguum IAM M-71]